MSTARPHPSQSPLVLAAIRKGGVLLTRPHDIRYDVTSESAEQKGTPVSEEIPYVGNLQWSSNGIAFNLRLTGDPQTDGTNMENLLGLRDTLVARDEVPAAQPTQAVAPPKAESAPAGEIPVCPVHGTQMRFVQGGVSKRTGKPYPAFYSCEDRNCNNTADAA